MDLVFFSDGCLVLPFLHALHQQPRVVVTTTAVTSICPKCGITKKSGTMSCCGRGGSWFGNCGGIRDTNIGHTWYEGLQACKAQAQSKTVIGQELSDVSQERNASSSGVDIANSKSVAMAAKSAASASSRMAGAPPTVVSANIAAAYTSFTINSKPLVAAITAPTSVAEIMSTLTSTIATVDTPITTTAHMSMSHNLTTTPMAIPIPVRMTVTSQGCKYQQFLVYFCIFAMQCAERHG